MIQQNRIKCEIYRDSMQNYKKYAIPRHNLLSQMFHIMLETTFMALIQCGTTGGTIRMEKANLPGKLLLILILILTCMNIFIFALRC